MDTIILQISAHIPQVSMTIGHFYPILINSVNALTLLLSLFWYADKSKEFNKQRKKQFHGNHHHDEEEDVFDFIVVGGGTSGSIVTSRLIEANFSVLLLEKGGEAHPLTKIPAMETYLLAQEQTDYSNIGLAQQRACGSMQGRRPLLSSGKGLGGSSNIGNMVYFRGHPYDYDIWSHYTKSHRWSYEKMLPYFLKAEDFCFECFKLWPVNPPFHSSTGPLPLATPHPPHPLTTPFLSSFSQQKTPQATAIPPTDLNAPFVRGTSPAVLTMDPKTFLRVSTFDSHLSTHKISKRLKIKKYSTAIRVLFHGDDSKDSKKKRAYAIEYEQFGKLKIAGAKNEIILSAGAFESPRILLQSTLNVSMGKIGENLQVHVGALLGPFLFTNTSKSGGIIPQRDFNKETVKEFFHGNTGPLSQGSSVQAIGILPSSKAEFKVWPDIQISLLGSFGVSMETAKNLERIYNIEDGLFQSFFSEILPENKKFLDAFFLQVQYNRPKSRGSVKLINNKLVIDPNYFGNQGDLDILVEGLMTSVNLIEGGKMGAVLANVKWPKCREFLFKSEPYFRCLATELTVSDHGFVGTVAMGPEGESSSLDPELRVRGVGGLRVIDGSVMPFVNSLGVLGGVVGVAEVGIGGVVGEWGEDDDLGGIVVDGGNGL